MRSNVLARDVRAEHLVSIAVAIKDETRLPLLQVPSVSTRAQEYPKLERHVEPRESIGGIQGRARKIMYAKSAIPDDLIQLLDADLAAVIPLLGATSNQSALVYCKDECLKKLFVSIVERDVKEDLPLVRLHMSRM
jgi:hypothetical protein